MRAWVTMLAVALMACGAQAREHIRIVGSGSVFPFSAAVAEHFGRAGGYKTPIVEGTGTGGGIQMFCDGAGEDTPDLVNASRPMKPAERERCATLGAHNVAEFVLGYDGLTLVNAKGQARFALSRGQLFQALAMAVVKDGAIIPNPYRFWDEIAPELPHQRIAVYGPPPTSGTRDAFVELVMLESCKQFPEFRAAYPSDDAFKQHCSLLREDGHYLQASDDGNLIVQKLINNPDALGVLSYSYLEQNTQSVQAHPVDGVLPTMEAIVAGKYPLSRHLLVYAKGEHLAKVPGMRAFLAAQLSEAAIGDEGYLVLKGLIPLPLAQRKAMRAQLAAWADGAAH